VTLITHLEAAIRAAVSALSALRTGAAVPARDVALTIILLPLALWVIYLLATPRRTRRAARR
jgi:hypothetical protein